MTSLFNFVRFWTEKKLKLCNYSSLAILQAASVNVSF